MVMMGTPEASALPALATVPMDSARPFAIRPFEETIAKEWDRFVLSHPEAAFFHQSAWKRVMEKTYGYAARYFYAECEGRIVGIAPAFLISNWVMGRCLISLPFAVYGGVCAENEEIRQALTEHLERFAEMDRVEYLELRDRKGDVLPGYHANPRYATFTMPLQADTEALYNALPKDIRYMVRKGEKAGLTVRRGFDQLEAFYALMTLNLRRLGTPTFPRKLFESLAREYPGQVELLLVYSNGIPFAGGMIFLFRGSAQPYYVGAREDAKAVAANDFLWWQMIKYAAETGCTEFDFGRSKLHSGNYDFKRKWKPHIENLAYQVRLVQRKTVPNFSPTNAKFELATNIWKRLPLGITRVLGPRVVRWFP